MRCHVGTGWHKFALTLCQGQVDVCQSGGYVVPMGRTRERLRVFDIRVPLTEEEKTAVQRIALTESSTMAETMRRALREYVDRIDRKS